MWKKRGRSLLAVVVITIGFMLGGARQSAAQSGCSTFEQTGQEVCYDFLQYWADHGGVAQQGYPISGRLQEISATDGKAYLVQYFERAVFELHPELDSANSVLLSLLGTFRYQAKYPGGAPGQEPNRSVGSVEFKETGKRVGGVFLDYWNKHGGLAQQGLPISDEFTEKSDLDGKSYKVQYFERAVFEYHPENHAPYDVLLSQLGLLHQQERAGSTVSFTTDDGVKLSGSQYGKGSTAVILSAQCSKDGKDGWTDFAVKLASRGYMALTYYYRGLGKSEGPADTTLLVHDLQAAIGFARSQGATKLVLAGGSCGGTISAKLYTSEKPNALVILSSGASMPNIEVSDEEFSKMTVPKLFISSQDDPGSEEIEQMWDRLPQPKERLLYSGSAHATDLFVSEHGQDLSDKLMAFIEANVPAK
jgi:alpha/beta superfamily hydrolase